jgi:hypothetical protein
MGDKKPENIVSRHPKGAIMGINTFLKAWGIFTAAWMVAVVTLIYPHYAPVFMQSNFIYNPWVNPNRLLADSQENMEILKRSFIQGWSNIYSFGVPGEVEISFSKQIYRDGHLETWMPLGSNLSSVRSDSSDWLDFRNTLTNEALRLREKAFKEIYNQHALKDAVLAFSAPCMLIFGFVAARLARRSGGKEIRA